MGQNTSTVEITAAQPVEQTSAFVSQFDSLAAHSMLGPSSVAAHVVAERASDRRRWQASLITCTAAAVLLITSGQWMPAAVDTLTALAR